MHDIYDSQIYMHIYMHDIYDFQIYMHIYIMQMVR